MRIIHVYVDDETQRRLEHYASESERTVEDLAEAAVSEAALHVRMPKGAK